MKKFMWMSLLIGFVAAGSFAATQGVQRCWLATQKGPYTSFEIQYEVDGRKLLSQTAAVTIRYAEESGSGGERATLRGIRFSEDTEQSTVRLSFDHNDWQNTTMEIGADDDGAAAFVTFNSDGPQIRSFYRCSKFPFEIP